MSATDLIQDDIISYQISLRRIEAGMRLKTVATLEQLESDIVETLLKNAKGLSAGKQASLIKTLAETRKQIVGIYRQITSSGYADLEAIAQATSAHTAMSLGKHLGVETGAMRLSASQVQHIAHGPIIEGSALEDWWDAQLQPTQAAISKEIQQGMLLGEGIEEIARRIRGTAKNNYADGIIDQGPKRKAEAIVRSAVQNTANEAGLATMQKSAVVKGVRWISTLDSRTTPICRALDGLKWDLEHKPIEHNMEWPGATAHFGCRSTQVAVLYSWDEIAGKPVPGQDKETFEENFRKRLAEKGKTPEQIVGIEAKQRESVDGPVDSNSDFTAWAKTKGPEYVRKLLGPGRFKLYQANNLTMRDLVDQKGRELTIAQLEAAIEAGDLPDETEGTGAFKQFIDPTPKSTKQEDSTLLVTKEGGKEEEEEDEAKAKIDNVLANPKGKTLLAKALTKLLKVEPDTPAHLMLAKAEGMAQEAQAAASLASKLSTAKKKILKGKAPSASEQAAIDNLAPDGLDAFMQGVKDGKAQAAMQAQVAQVPSTTQPDLDVKNQDIYIPDPGTLVFVKTLPGSTNPKLMVDPVTGKQWVVKSPEQGGGGPGHLKSEAISDKIYRLMGAAVPASEYKKIGGKHYKIAEYIEGAETLGQWQNHSNAADQNGANANLREHFVLDALLGNRDVAGQNNDNILVRLSDGKPIRIDNGGALAYRAMGAKKVGDEFGPLVGELATMRNPSIAAGKTAEIFKGITQGEINTQIVAIVEKQDEIVDLVEREISKTVARQLRERIKYLESQLPASLRKPASSLSSDGREKALVPKFDELVKHANGKGAHVAAGSTSIEDQEFIAWRETTANGEKMIKLQGYLTRQGSESFVEGLVAAGIDTNEKTKAMQAYQAQYQAVTTSKFDKVWSEAAQAAKNIGYHSNDGNYSQVALIGLEQAKNKIAAIKMGLPAVVSTPADKEKKGLVDHYEKMFADLDNAKKNKIKPGGPGGGKLWEPYMPPVAKAVTTTAATANTTEAVINGVTVRRIEGKDIVYTRKVASPDGLVDSGVFNHGASNNVHYLLQAGPVTATVVPYRTDNSLKENRALQGLIRVNIEANDDIAATLEGLRVLEAAGIDTAPPTRAQKELLYLHKTIYLRGDEKSPDYVHILNNKGLSEEQKVNAIKDYAETRYRVPLPRNQGDYHKYYNPDGELDIDGGGRKIYRRWDVDAQEALKIEDNAQFIHQSDDVGETTLGWLRSGQVTSTTDRMRQGVPLRTVSGIPIGASWEEDYRVGGSDFIYTSKAAKDRVANARPGFHFKGDSITRVDLASHNYDSWGAWEANEGSGRRRTLDEINQVSNKITITSNTGLFKHGLRIQDIDYIQTPSASARAAVISKLKAAGFLKWPDGRTLDAVIK